VGRKWELLLPVVALVALFGGFATPVEAAAVTALYAFIVETSSTATSGYSKMCRAS